MVLRPLAALLCRAPGTKSLCFQHIVDWTGPHWHLNETNVDVYTSHSNAGTSMMNMLHYYQSLENKEFVMYDHGEAKNKEKYGQVSCYRSSNGSKNIKFQKNFFEKICFFLY